MNKTGTAWWSAAAVMAAAAISTWGWAPLGWWPLIPMAFSVLLHTLTCARSLWTALGLGWAFGTATQLVGHRWMYTAMTAKAGISPLEAALEFGGLGLYLGLSTSLAALGWKALHRTRGQYGGLGSMAPSAVSFAALFTLAEWARSVAFGGFSSLSIGYAFADTWMRGYMPIGGVWCASFAVLLATAMACGTPGLASRWQQAMAAFAAIGLVACGTGLARVNWVQALGPPLSYRLLQPNVTQEHKFDPAHTARQLDALTRLLESAHADIILAPETAVPLFFTQLPAELIERWQAWSITGRSHLYVGMPMLSEAGMAHNAMLHIDPTTQALTAYKKVRLMPFGEYTPTGFEWTTRDLALPLKDLVSGSTDQAPLRGPGAQHVGMLMCQEELMGEDSRLAATHAGVILNPSNLAWFDESAALAQRLQIVRVRALETGRPILRSANTGVTAHIDHTGKVKAAAPERRLTALSGMVQPMQGRTLYAALGDLPFLAVALGWLFVQVAVTIRFRFVSEHP